MIPDLGYVLLIIALISSFLQAISFFNFSNFLKAKRLLSAPNFSAFATSVTSASIIGAFACLIYSYIISDFSVLNVYKNSHTDKPLFYKIAGSWGNHEGSMLLFLSLLSILNFLFMRFSKFSMKNKVLAVQSALVLGIISYVFFTSNPFVRLFPVPENGMGLNPLLQDVGLAMHPPMLYCGYVGFSIALSFAIVGLISGQINREWAVHLRPWVMVSWSFLTLGIGLGSWWAYRELGWGGFWFWDPVENSSLLPWLAGTTLLHSLVVLEKRETLAGWTTLMAIITFCLSLIGFFLVRSGVLNSVHAFASDPYRGIFMLIFLAIVGGGSLTIYGLYSHKLKNRGQFAAISKESSILVNNLLLVSLCITVLLGTLYPIFLEVLSDERVSVGGPYFNIVFMPIAVSILIFAGIGPYLNWKSNKIKDFAVKLWLPTVVGLMTFIISLYYIKKISASCGFALSSWLFISTFTQFTGRVRLLRVSISNSLKKAKELPLRFYAMIIAHIGVAVLAAAITAVTTWQEDRELLMMIDRKVNIGEYEVTFKGTDLQRGPNYLARVGEFDIWRGNTEVVKLYPESRIYFEQGTHTTEADVYYNLRHDLYIVIGDRIDNVNGTGGKGFSVRIYYKPYMMFIWIGCIMMAIGGIVSVCDLLNRNKKKSYTFDIP